jgi:hemolysin activation/secretion protein
MNKRVIASIDRRASRFLITAGVLIAGPTTAAAPPPPPNPGAISGGLIDKGEALQGGVAAPPKTTTTPGGGAAPARAGGPEFVVTKVEFSPSRFLKASELATLASRVTAKPVTLADLQRVVDDINTLYAKRGVLTARAFLPPQRISGGVVHIQLVESKLGALDVKPGAYTRARFASARIASKPGAVLDPRDLQRQIGRFNRNNDSQVQASLSPGRDPGTTDILLSLRDPPRNGLQLFVDNNGYESTGRLEGGLLLRRNRLFLDGDHASLYLVGSGGSVTGSLSYNAPVDLTGGRLGVSYARSDIRVISGATSALGVIGTTNTASINIAQPLVSLDSWTLSAVGTASFVESSDRISHKTVDSEYLGKATGGLSATTYLWRFGRLTGDLQASRAAVYYVTGKGAADFWAGNADFDFATVPWRGLSLHVSGAGEYLDHRDVPGTQLFQLGGDSSVRGYQPGYATGHAGYAVQSELHAAVPGLKRYLDPYVFADTGQVYSGLGQHARADGAGVGFNLTLLKRLTIQASYAFALDTLATSQYGNRLDLKASLSF